MTIRGSRRPNVVPITAPSFPTVPQPRIYRKIAYTFGVLTLIIVLAVLWLSSVRADVLVKVKRSQVRLDGTVEVARSPRSGQIPGRVVQGVFEKIQEFDVSIPSSTQSATSTAGQSATLASTGTSTSSESVRARGTVRVVNTYSRSQTLVEKTRLLTSDNKLYRIEKRIVIPAGGEASVSVYADQIGEEFVIGPSRFTIPGLWIDLQKYIYAVSDTPFVATPESTAKPREVVEPRRATPSLKKVVQTRDLDDAHRLLAEQVLDQAKKTLASELADTKFTDVVYFTKVLEKKANVLPGQSAETFLASLKLEVTAVYYPPEDMTALIRSRLKEKIPDGREFLPFQDGSVAYTLESVDLKAEVASVRVVAEADYRLTSTSPALQKSTVTGRNKDEAASLLKSLEGVEDVTIQLRPSWLRKIPSLKDRVTIKVE